MNKYIFIGALFLNITLQAYEKRTDNQRVHSRRPASVSAFLHAPSTPNVSTSNSPAQKNPARVLTPDTQLFNTTPDSDSEADQPTHFTRAYLTNDKITNDKSTQTDETWIETMRALTQQLAAMNQTVKTLSLAMANNNHLLVQIVSRNHGPIQARSASATNLLALTTTLDSSQFKVADNVDSNG